MDDKRLETIFAGFTHIPMDLAIREALRYVRDEAYREGQASLDLCVCGDYRKDHENSTGRCKMPDDLSHAFEPCLKFQPTK